MRQHALRQGVLVTIFPPLLQLLTTAYNRLILPMTTRQTNVQPYDAFLILCSGVNKNPDPDLRLTISFFRDWTPYELTNQSLAFAAASSEATSLRSTSREESSRKSRYSSRCDQRAFVEESASFPTTKWDTQNKIRPL